MHVVVPTVVASVGRLAVLAAGGEQRLRPLHGARALRGDLEGRSEYTLHGKIEFMKCPLVHEFETYYVSPSLAWRGRRP